MGLFSLAGGLSLLFVLFSLTFLTFVVGRLATGDPVQRMMGNRHDPVRYQELVHQYGLDRPIWHNTSTTWAGWCRATWGCPTSIRGGGSARCWLIAQLEVLRAAIEETVP